MDVIGYGDADIDIFLSVPHLPGQDEKVLAKNYSFHPGGMIVNTLVSLRRLGRNVGYHGRIGDDDFGKKAIQNLEANHVDTGGVIHCPGGQTFFCVVLVDPSGEKALVSAATDCRERHAEEVSGSYISQARHLHTTAIFLEAANRAVDLAKQNGLSVSLDLDAGTAQKQEQIWNLLSKVDLLFVNQRGVRNLTGLESIDEALQAIVNHTKNIVCVTLGGEGCVAASPEELVQAKAFDVKVIDTTGAGDCFASGFIHAYLSKWPLEYAALFANAVAAMNTTGFGGHTNAPSLEETLRFLEKKGVSPYQV